MSEIKVPPQSFEAERSVLGAILIDKNAIVEVAGFLRPAHFYDERHGDIFAAMLALYEERHPIDLLTLTEKLKAQKKYKDVGGSGYLSELTTVVPTAAHVEEYGRIIRELCAKRELISVSAAVSEMSFDAGKKLQEVLDSAESKIFNISQENLERNFVSMKEILAQSFDRLDEIQKRGGGMRGIASGWKDLDDTLAGFQDSNLIILAARPGIGKTAFLLNIALHVAVKEKVPVGIFSLEMSQEELGDRLLVLQAGIDSWRLKTGRLEEEDLDKLQDAMGVLADAPIYIDDTPGITLMEMRTKARRLQMEHRLKLVLVDYLQLVNPGRSLESRVQEVSIVSQALKNLARELRVPLISASQLNRAVEARGTKKPQLADLRESGCLTGETLIMLADSGKLATIASLVGRLPFSILALDQNLKIRKFLVKKVFSSGIKKVFRLKLRSGREIRASANHRFKTLYEWKRLDRLSKGEKIAVPRIIKLNPITTFSQEKLIILAHMIGDGCYVNRQPIHYTSGNKTNINVVKKAAQRGFGVTGKVVNQENWWHVYLTNDGKNPIISWFRELEIFGQHSYEKIIPDFVFGLKNDKIALFLSHLWATDGNLSSANEGGMAIYYSTTSHKLAHQVQHLLLRFGILSQIRLHKKTGYRDGYIVDISGKTNQLIFLDKVGVFGKTKEMTKAKKTLENLEANPNLDVIPTDVYWDEIEAIIPDGSQEVFDLTVDQAHNFIAGDIIVHNSIEQDADVVMFLYRPEDTKDLAPSDKIPTILSIDKHRNGALGEKAFMFNGPLMQFRLQAK